MVLKKDDLINWFEEGCKPKELFRIGTEHEKFVYKIDSLKPVSYEEESGIRNILMKLVSYGWEEVSYKLAHRMNYISNRLILLWQVYLVN